jgi:hypothetical protein
MMSRRVLLATGSFLRLGFFFSLSLFPFDIELIGRFEIETHIQIM